MLRECPGEPTFCRRTFGGLKRTPPAFAALPRARVDEDAAISRCWSPVAGDPGGTGKCLLSTAVAGGPCRSQRSRAERVYSMDFSDFFWLLVWSFFFVAYLMVLFQVIGDLFRDQELSGWAKAAWVVALIVVRLLSLLVYLIARGRGMGRRQEAVIRQAQSDTEQYIKSVAAQASPVDQVTSAKALFDEGPISEPEYERLKAKALA